MAQNVTIAGNQYPSVPSILIPKTGGGGNATFVDTSPTTASASDVAQGKIFFDSTGSQQTGTASGGASNIVTGTFTGTTTGAAMNVTLNYSGSGYPIAVVIYPSGGVDGNTTFHNLIQRYVCIMYCATKSKSDTSPEYNRTTGVDEYVVVNRYKSSASSALTATQTGGIVYVASNIDATGASYYIVQFNSKTTMSVFIASESYGFAANIEYTYQIIYSS